LTKRVNHALLHTATMVTIVLMDQDQKAEDRKEKMVKDLKVCLNHQPTKTETPVHHPMDITVTADLTVLTVINLKAESRKTQRNLRKLSLSQKRNLWKHKGRNSVPSFSYA